MDAFVVDASMAIAWVHPAQATDESDAWLDRVVAGAELVVPALWPLTDTRVRIRGDRCALERGSLRAHRFR